MAARFRNPLRWPLYLQTLVAMLVGGLVGAMCGPEVGRSLGHLAGFIVEVVKVLAIPLLLLAIYDAVIRNEFRSRGVLALAVLCAINGLSAVTIAMLIANLFQPGRYMPVPAGDLGSGQVAPSTGGIAELILGSPMMIAIVVGVTSGLVTLLVQHITGPRSWNQTVRTLSERGLGLTMRVIVGVVHVVPIAVFASAAKATGEHGLELIGGLGAYTTACLGGMLLHVLFVYHGWIILYARIGWRRFWRAAREPVVYAFGVNSSLATLPLTLRALDDLGVSPGAARLSACVGTNFNNDGILLYEVVVVLFLSQAYGLQLSLGEQLLTAMVCVLATVGVGGIPEAGIISLSLVLTAVNLPLAGIPLLLSVDWILARCRSSVNVLGDMAVAIAIDRLDRVDGDSATAS
jgi:DAACS family dicarboxylate/amino acid:cation (Na+ or H+) symporter